jgi:hypothetical protein
MAFPSDDYGLDKPLLIEAASHPRPFVAKAASTLTNGSVDPASASVAARAFIDDLFTRGRVNYEKLGLTRAHLDHGRRICSHELVPEGNAIRLRRCLFDCGFAP